MRVPVPSALPWSSMDCNDQQGVCPAPSAALGVNQRLSNTVLPQFSRIPAHPPGQGTGYLGTDPHRSSWTDCLSLGQLVQSPVVSSSTQSSPAPRSSLLGTVLSALGMQSTEVTPITRVTAAREDGDEIQHGDHPSRSEKSGLGVCHGDRDWGRGQGLSGQLLGKVHSISRAAPSAAALSQGDDQDFWSRASKPKALPPPCAGSGHAGSCLPPTPLGFRPFCFLPLESPQPRSQCLHQKPLSSVKVLIKCTLSFFLISNSICVLFSYNNR